MTVLFSNNLTVKRTPCWNKIKLWINELKLLLHCYLGIITLQVKFWISEWSSQLCTQLKQLRKESLKKIQAWTGFEPMTSAMWVQCSTNWAIKPTGSQLPVQCLTFHIFTFKWNYVGSPFCKCWRICHIQSLHNLCGAFCKFGSGAMLTTGRAEWKKRAT